MIGNLKTLQHEDIRDVLLNLISKRLLEFHKRYYSSNVMKLVVYGQEPLETLEEWTKQLFGEITN
jgi:insulysin